MDVNGYALKRKDTGAVILNWLAIPARIDIPDTLDVVMGASDGWGNDVYEITTYVWQEPDPVAQPRMIEKATVLSRLTDDQLAQAISLMTLRQQEKWRMPGYPSVSVEDADLLAVLKAVGADAETVLAA